MGTIDLLFEQVRKEISGWVVQETGAEGCRVGWKGPSDLW